MADQEEEQREEEQDIDRFVRAKEANRALLLSRPNVIGLDVGYRTRAGEVTEERVVKVYVQEKVRKSDLAEQDLIPPSVEVRRRGGVDSTAVYLHAEVTPAEGRRKHRIRDGTTGQ